VDTWTACAFRRRCEAIKRREEREREREQICLRHWPKVSTTRHAGIPPSPARTHARTHRSNHPASPPTHLTRAPTGLIIAASVLVAAGIAIYESPQVREWVDQSRRKIALALHSLGDELQPRRPSESEGDFDARQERVRRRRNELVKRAREEGVAVDLDELVRIGREEAEREEHAKAQAQWGRGGRADRTRSFDELVGDDGALRTGVATGADVAESGARKRGGGGGAAAGAGFAAGALAGAAVANPFDDDNLLFDVGDGEDTFVSTSTPAEAETEPDSRDSSATLAATPLVDLTPDTTSTTTDADTDTAAADADADVDVPAQSFYSFTSDAEIDPEFHSSGTLTPRSSTSHSEDPLAFSVEDAFSTQANDNDTDAFSDGGFTDAFSEGGFSDVGTGAMTPSSWTDVGSDEGSEWGGAGDVSQVQV
jgi:hypothetical protein